MDIKNKKDDFSGNGVQLQDLRYTICNSYDQISNINKSIKYRTKIADIIKMKLKITLSSFKKYIKNLKVVGSHL